MDLFLLVYGLFLFATGYLSGLVFTWLWFKTVPQRTPSERERQSYPDIHDTVDMILESLEF